MSKGLALQNPTINILNMYRSWLRQGLFTVAAAIRYDSGYVSNTTLQMATVTGQTQHTVAPMCMKHTAPPIKNA